MHIITKIDGIKSVPLFLMAQEEDYKLQSKLTFDMPKLKSMWQCVISFGMLSLQDQF
jgi:hypothetical protein